MNRTASPHRPGFGAPGTRRRPARWTGPRRAATALDLRGLAPPRCAGRSVSRRRGGAVRVTFQPAEWPSVKLARPPGAGRGTGAPGIPAARVEQPGRPRDRALGIRIDDDPAADGRTHCRTAQVKLRPGEAATLAVALTRADPMAHGMRGLPSYPGTRTVTASGPGPSTSGTSWRSSSSSTSPHGPADLEIRSARLEPELSLGGHRRPARPVRRGGLARARSSPNRTWSRRHELEAADLKAHPEPPDRDRFGGWRDGPKQKATGFFRAARRSTASGGWSIPTAPSSSRWASTSSTPNEATIITGRESMFTALAPAGEPLARYFGTARRSPLRPGQGGQDLQFLRGQPGADVRPRLLGPLARDHPEPARSPGASTRSATGPIFGLYRNGRVPYVATVTISGNHARVGSGSDYWGKMHDPFDPAVRHERPERASASGPPGQGRSLVPGLLRGQRAELGRVRRRGRPLRPGPRRARPAPRRARPPSERSWSSSRRSTATIARLNAAWGTTLRDWQALEAPWKPAGRPSAWTEAIQGRPGRVREGAGADLFQDGARPAQGRRSRPPVPRLPVCLADRGGRRRRGRVLRRGQLQHLRPPGRSRRNGRS